MINCKWKILTTLSELNANKSAKELSQQINCLLPTAQLLINRGYDTKDKAIRFLKKTEEYFIDPFKLEDMDKAVEKVLETIKSNQSITIYGDYDADGITSTALLYLYLKNIGAKVNYYIPDRKTEGYGMTIESIKKIINGGTSLIITVDNGITAFEEVEYAVGLNVDVIITDHHTCFEKLPNAFAVINPHRADCLYEYKELAGVGVAYKFICAIEIKNNKNVGIEESVFNITEKYADLVALGTIADLMPVNGENRLIISEGIKLIKNHTRVSLNALVNEVIVNDLSKTSVDISTSFISYQLAPRINAAGRIGDASDAVKLLVSENYEIALKYSKILCSYNRQRKEEENIIYEQIKEKINKEYENQIPPIIVMSDNNWDAGIIGIVSSRVAEKYNRPCILITFKGDNGETDIGRGSGRSTDDYDLFKAIKTFEKYFVKFGGHKLAAGLTIKRENYHLFKDGIIEYSKTHETRDNNQKEIIIDCEIACEHLTMKQAIELNAFEPFGISNEVPIFLIRDMTVQQCMPLSNGKHIKMLLLKNNIFIKAIYFNTNEKELNIYNGDHIDVAAKLEVNNYKGMKNLQLNLENIKLSKEQVEKEDKERASYKKLLYFIENNMHSKNYRNIVPSRDDFVSLYNYLCDELNMSNYNMSIKYILHSFDISKNDVEYCKLKIMLRVFSEMGLFRIENIEDDYIIKYSERNTTKKVNLNESKILSQLKEIVSD